MCMPMAVVVVVPSMGMPVVIIMSPMGMTVSPMFMRMSPMGMTMSLIWIGFPGILEVSWLIVCMPVVVSMPMGMLVRFDYNLDSY